MFERLLEQIAAELASRSIPYLIVAGQAVLVNVEPRLTRDIDVTLGVNVDRLDELLAIFTRAREFFTHSLFYSFTPSHPHLK